VPQTDRKFLNKTDFFSSPSVGNPVLHYIKKIKVLGDSTQRIPLCLNLKSKKSLNNFYFCKQISKADDLGNPGPITPVEFKFLRDWQGLYSLYVLILSLFQTI